MPQIIEARMLFKIKGVRRDLREFYGPPDFIILLNSKEFQITLRGRRKAFLFCYVQSPNVTENKGSTKFQKTGNPECL
jgi:hypothetical protein